MVYTLNILTGFQKFKTTYQQTTNYVSVMIAAHSPLGLSATRDTQPNLLSSAIFLGLILGQNIGPFPIQK